MKRILPLVFAFIFVFRMSYAQEAALKNFRFGLKLVPVFTWIKPDDIKQFKNTGLQVKFNYGLVTEFKLTKTAVFCTGFDFNSYGGKIEYQNNTTRYEIADLSKTDSAVAFYIKSRTYNMKTYELPLTLKLRTPEIGNITYFGQFGVNVGVRGKVKSEDEGKYISTITIICKDASNWHHPGFWWLWWYLCAAFTYGSNRRQYCRECSVIF